MTWTRFSTDIRFCKLLYHHAFSAWAWVRRHTLNVLHTYTVNNKVHAALHYMYIKTFLNLNWMHTFCTVFQRAVLKYAGALCRGPVLSYLMIGRFLLQSLRKNQICLCPCVCHILLSTAVSNCRSLHMVAISWTAPWNVVLFRFLSVLLIANTYQGFINIVKLLSFQ